MHNQTAPTANVNKTGSSAAMSLFFYLLLLTAFFFLLEISFFIQCNKAYLSDFSFVSSQLQIPLSILPGILYFIFAHLLIHFMFCMIVWGAASSIARFFHAPPHRQIPLGIGIWVIGIVTLLVANQVYFPNSKFAGLTGFILFSPAAASYLLSILSICCLFFIIFAGLGCLHLLYKSWGLWPGAITLCAVIAALGFSFLKPALPVVHDAATRERPNIILVGVDSLRPDFLGFFGHDNRTPFMDAFLNQATVFAEAVTPLARTFPSWAGILTGQYPRQTGIRFNLAQQDKLNLAQALPAILRRNGYETVFATDEVRFSNLDKNFGFNQVITPPMGLNDFLLGTFNDFPLSNLLVNTSLGKWLFPYSYANRAVYFNYEPDSFLHLLDSTLEAHRTKPMMLAVHFCLPHHPYLWASLSGEDYSIRERYQKSIQRVDRQLRDFFMLLKKNHLLDHAIVVLLSDHGEALELAGDRITEKDLFLPARKREAIPRFYPPSLDDEAINQSAGHGTDVLGLPQYHTLLAFRLYGAGDQQKNVVPGAVSLLDIKPTLLALLGITDSAHVPLDNPLSCSSCTSLVSVIKGGGKLPSSRHIFLESDFSPEAIRTVYPETRKVLLEGIQLFQIDPVTTRLTVKASMGQMIIHSKQYADIYGDWMLALYPQHKDLRMPILVNLANGQWTNDLQSSFARRSPAAMMLRELKAFYSDEISTV